MTDLNENYFTYEVTIYILKSDEVRTEHIAARNFTEAFEATCLFYDEPEEIEIRAIVEKDHLAFVSITSVQLYELRFLHNGDDVGLIVHTDKPQRIFLENSHLKHLQVFDGEAHRILPE